MILTYSGKKKSSTAFVYMEQPDNDTQDKADLADQHAMLDYAQADISPWQYLQANCPQVEVLDDVQYLTLDIYVFPSSGSLDYRLSITAGQVLDFKQPLLLRHERDLKFERSASEQLKFIFSGSTSFGMPALDSNGQDIPGVIIDHDESIISLSESCTTALRLAGYRVGYTHRIKVSFDDLRADEALVLTAAWEEDQYTMKIDVPDCVASQLDPCAGSSIPPDDPHWAIYVDDCTGEVLGRKFG